MWACSNLLGQRSALFNVGKYKQFSFFFVSQPAHASELPGIYRAVFSTIRSHDDHKLGSNLWVLRTWYYLQVHRCYSS